MRSALAKPMARAQENGYILKFKVMGQSRNSYFKTDPNATFMRRKGDYMRNRQLKPACNVQFAVASE